MKKKLLLFLPLLFLVLLLVAFLSLRAYFNEQRILALLEPQLEEALGQPVHITSAALQAFPLAVALHGIEIHDKTATQVGDTPMISVESLRCDIDTAPLLRRKLLIRSLTVDSLRVHLRQRPDSTWNVAPTTATNNATSSEPVDSEAAPLSLTIRSLEIRHALLDIEIPAQQLGVIIPLDATLQFETNRQMSQVTLQGDIQCTGITGKPGALESLRDLQVRLQPRLRIDLPDSTAQIEEFKLQLQDLRVALAGEIRLQDGQPHGRLQTKSDQLQLADLLSLIPTAMAPQLEEFDAAGLVDLDLEIELRGAEPPAIHGSLHLREAVLQSAELPEDIHAIEADLLWNNDRLELQKFQAQYLDNPIRIQGVIKNPLEPERTALDLRIDGRLSLQAAAAFATLPPGVSMQGALAAQIHAVGLVQDPNNLQVTGTLALQDAIFKTAQLNHPIRVEASATLHDKSLQLDQLTAQVGKTTAKVTGKVAPLVVGVLPKVELRGSATHIDLDDLLPAKVTSQATSHQAATAGSQPAATTLLPANLLTDVEITIDIDSAEYQKAHWQAIHLQASGSTTGFRLTATVDSLRRDALHMQAMRLQLAGDSLRADGSVTARSATLGRVNAGQFRSKLFVEGTDVQLPDMTAALYGGTLQGKATFDLANASAPKYDMSLEMQAVEAGQLLADVLPGGQWMSGKLQGSSQWSSSGADPKTLRSNLTASGTAQATAGTLHRFPLVDAFTQSLQMNNTKDIRYNDLGLRFDIGKGLVRIPQLNLRSKEFTVETNGTVDLNGKLQLQTHVILSEEQSKQYLKGDIGSAIHQLFADPEGRVVLDFNVDGNLRAPRFQPDLAATAARSGLRSLDSGDLGRLLDEVLPKTDDNSLRNALQRSLGGLLGGKDKKAPADSTGKH